MPRDFKQGDTRPKVQYRPTENTRDVTLPSDATAAFRLIDRHDNVAVVSGAQATVESTDPATLSYTFAAGETDVVGEYDAEFVVSYSDGGQRTFPDDGYISVSINPRLDADGTVSVDDTRHDVTVGTVDALAVDTDELSVTHNNEPAITREVLFKAEDLDSTTPLAFDTGLLPEREEYQVKAHVGGHGDGTSQPIQCTVNNYVESFYRNIRIGTGGAEYVTAAYWADKVLSDGETHVDWEIRGPSNTSSSTGYPSMTGNSSGHITGNFLERGQLASTNKLPIESIQIATTFNAVATVVITGVSY